MNVSALLQEDINRTYGSQSFDPFDFTEYGAMNVYGPQPELHIVPATPISEGVSSTRPEGTFYSTSVSHLLLRISHSNPFPEQLRHLHR